MRRELRGPAASATNVVPLRPYDLVDSNGGAELPRKAHPLDGAIHGTSGSTDRDHMLDRLHHLRMIIPVFAQELASSRRQAAALRVENRGLVDEVRRLRRERGDGLRA